MGSHFASTDMLDKLLDDSEKSFTEQQKELEEKRGTVDTSKGHDVKTLTMLFGGPEAQQRKLEKSLADIERELKKGQYQLDKTMRDKKLDELPEIQEFKKQATQEQEEEKVEYKEETDL